MNILLVVLTGLAMLGDTPEACKDNKKTRSANDTCDGGKDNKKVWLPNKGDGGQDNNNDKPPEVSTEDPEGGGEKTKSSSWIPIPKSIEYILCSFSMRAIH